MARTSKQVQILLVILWLCLPALTAESQTQDSGNLRSRVDSLISVMPGSGSASKYRPPTGAEMAQWASAVTAILEQDLRTADSLAALFGYHVVAFADVSTVTQRNFYLLEENTGSGRFWGTYIFSAVPRRPKLMIQSPHSLYDSNTGKQGFVIFFKNEALAFCMNGAHRCNHPDFTPCSGTTTACSDTSAPYRISDQAHVVDGMFQVTTQAVKSRVPDIVVLQPHGFAKQTGDPDLIMSNGTPLTPTYDPLLVLRDHLASIDPVLTFKIAHVNTDWTRLIATTNTQGRLLNGSANPCTQSASSATGRFIHIEQAYSRLRDSETNREKLATAVGLTFEPITGVVPSPSLVGIPADAVLLDTYPNPFNPSTTIQFSLPTRTRVSLQIFTALGQHLQTLVDEERSAGVHRVPFEGSTLPSGLYLSVLTSSAGRVVRPMMLLK